jgi:hypothetical protein
MIPKLKIRTPILALSAGLMARLLSRVSSCF